MASSDIYTKQDFPEIEKAIRTAAGLNPSPVAPLRYGGNPAGVGRSRASWDAVPRPAVTAMAGGNTTETTAPSAPTPTLSEELAGGTPLRSRLGPEIAPTLPAPRSPFGVSERVADVATRRARGEGVGLTLPGITPVALGDVPAASAPIEPPTTFGTVLPPGTLKAEAAAQGGQPTSLNTNPGQGVQPAAAIPWYKQNGWKISGKDGVTPAGETPTAVRRTVDKSGNPLLEARGIPELMPKGVGVGTPGMPGVPTADTRIDAAIAKIEANAGNYFPGTKNMIPKAQAEIVELEKARQTGELARETAKERNVQLQIHNDLQRQQLKQAEIAGQDTRELRKQIAADNLFQKDLTRFGEDKNTGEFNPEKGLFTMASQGLYLDRPEVARAYAGFNAAKSAAEKKKGSALSVEELKKLRNNYFTAKGWQVE